ncbi:MAG: hypothetical protein JRI68_08500, partial [Deltaproteobacteria bacterium]|nr:hypothetical protein [Deltaproteobacteria bacterium]
MSRWGWDRCGWLGPLLLGWVALACGPGTTSSARPTRPVATIAPVLSHAAAPPAADEPDAGEAPRLPEAAPDDRLAQEIRETLVRIATARELPVKHPVVGRRLSRDEVLEIIIAKAERDIPREALEAQGDLLRAFELIAVTYDFVGGIYELIGDNVAGLYDDDTARMILLDDLDDLVAEQTLAHELVHALQDQHYDLDRVLKYQSGHSDRVTAQHALAEGDATSAMLDVTQGSAFGMSNDNLRLLMVASVALSPGGSQTPRVLQAALVAPYLDGFAFVQELRRRGGWAEVDRVWQRMPTTT